MFLTAPSLPPPKLHGVGPQHLLAGNGRRGLGRHRLPGVPDLWRGGKGRQGLPVLAAALGIPGGKGPLEVHVAEGPRGGDGLRRDKAGLPLLGVEAAVVVLLCRAAPHRPGLGIGESEEGGLEGGGCPLLPGGEGMGRALPPAHVPPAPLAEGGHRGVQLQVDRPRRAAPELGVDPQHRPQGLHPRRQQGPQPVLLCLVG